MKTPLIAHVVYHFGTGGMENGMVNLFNNLSSERYRHAVICLTGHSGFRQRIQRDDIAFYDLDKQPGHDYSWHLRLARLLWSLKPDILHTRNLNALEAQFVAAALGVPGRVHGEHGRDVHDLHGKNWKYNLLRKAARPVVQRYIAVSRDLEAWLQHIVGVAPRRLRQVYNGVDSLRFRPRAPDAARLPVPGMPDAFLTGADCVIGSVGRLVGVKDYATLVRAFIRLQGRVQNPSGLRLLLVGEGSHRHECQQLLEQAGLSGQAWLAGDRCDTPELLRGMDVFVLPSLGEGISNTILEAMSTGLPVVATRVGGNPELVADGVSGRLVPPGQPEALTGALAAYAQAPELARQHGTAGRRRIESGYSLAAMAAAYAAVYDEVLARPSCS